MSILKTIIPQNRTERKAHGGKICARSAGRAKLPIFSQIFKKMIARSGKSVYNN